MSTCPTCQSPLYHEYGNGDKLFDCGSLLQQQGKHQTTPSCRARANNKRVAELEAEVERLKAMVRDVFSWEPCHEHQGLDTIGHSLWLDDTSRETIMDVLREEAAAAKAEEKP